MILRPFVEQLAQQMEENLRANAYKDHHSCDREFLIAKLFEECAELVAAAMAEGPSAELEKEAADVANVAGMLAHQSCDIALIDWKRW